MRTFQYSDAKSHKFWTIELTGKSFTVTYHVDTTTDSDPSVGNTAHASADASTAAPSTTSVAIVENVVLHVTKSFALPPGAIICAALT